jgi:hypothetical protein
MCPHTCICVLILLQVLADEGLQQWIDKNRKWYFYICVLIFLYMCPRVRRVLCGKLLRAVLLRLRVAVVISSAMLCRQRCGYARLEILLRY